MESVRNSHKRDWARAHAPEAGGCARRSVLLISLAPCVGGAERSLIEAATSLSGNADFGLAFLTPPNEGLRDRLTAHGVVAETIPRVRFEGLRTIASYFQLIGDMLRVVLSIRSAVRRRRTGLLHANGIKAGLPTAVAAVLTGTPWILHLRDYPRHKRLIRLLARASQLVVVSSGFMARALRETTGNSSSEVVVIPNGVEPPSAAEGESLRLRDSLRLSRGTILLCMVAQMAPWKRHDLLLEAVSLVLQRGIGVHVLLAGSDLWGLNSEYELRLMSRAQRDDLAGRVTFCGQREDIGAVLLASDIFVLPSENEPFGRSVIEAWWMGRPVIVSSAGGPAEIVENERTGLHFTNGSARELAAVIERLARDEDLRRTLGEAGQLEARRYTVDTHASAIAGLYRRLLRCE